MVACCLCLFYVEYAFLISKSTLLRLINILLPSNYNKINKKCVPSFFATLLGMNLIFFWWWIQIVPPTRLVKPSACLLLQWRNIAQSAFAASHLLKLVFSPVWFVLECKLINVECVMRWIFLPFAQLPPSPPMIYVIIKSYNKSLLIKSFDKIR